MQFEVLSRHNAERMTPPEMPHIIISITDCGSEPANIPVGKHCLGIHRVQFHDADHQGEKFLGRLLIAIEPDQAEAIWNFFVQHRDKAELTIVHCEAGISRSAGTAAALAVGNGQSDAFIFNKPYFNPNRRVFRMILNAATTSGHRIEQKREEEE